MAATGRDNCQHSIKSPHRCRTQAIVFSSKDSFQESLTFNNLHTRFIFIFASFFLSRLRETTPTKPLKMRPANHIPGSASLLTVFALLNGFAVPALAQNNKDDSSSSSSSASQTDSKSSSTKSSSSSSSTSSPSSSSSASSSPKSSSSSTSSSKSPPSKSTDGGAGLTGLPSLTGSVPIPTYPPAAVPDTKGAPFMQSSSAPEGTVFIAVGAILGAFFLAVLIWRAVGSLLLHRSVERASKAQHVENKKAAAAVSTSSSFPAPPAPFYKYTDQESTRSLGRTSEGGRGANRRSTRGPAPPSNTSQSNLFFSPTASNNGAGGNRGSTYLPSGFYAAGSAATAHQQGQSISLSNLNPASGHYANGSRNTLNVSPPESPLFHARRDASTSSINLAAPLQPGQRAPSAYLEDLLAEDPSALPPPHMPGAGSRR